MTRDEWEKYPVPLAILYLYDPDNDMIPYATVFECSGKGAFNEAINLKKDYFAQHGNIIGIIQANDLATTEHCDELMDELNLPTEFGEEDNGYATE